MAISEAIKRWTWVALTDTKGSLLEGEKSSGRAVRKHQTGFEQAWIVRNQLYKL
jgi:hypothetical protein